MSVAATVVGRPRVEPAPGATREDRRSWLLVAVVACLTSLPIVVGTTRALLDGWLAIGDNANFLIRSRDVLTAHHPLLGTWSSASLTVGEDVNHPGPLAFDLLAIPSKLGGSGGLAVGVAIIAAASVAGIAVFARRAGGTRLAVACLLAAAALEWSIGSSLLHDPWNPHVVLLPFLLLLVLVLAMAAGDTLALPFAAGVASLVVQTHLTYAVLAPVLCLFGVVLLVRRRGRDVVSTAVAAVIVLALCWAQPIADQVAGEGNLGALARGIGSSDETIGVTLGARLVADVVAVAPWWLRPSFTDAFRVPPLQPTHVAGAPNVDGLPSTATAAVSLVAVAAVVAGSWLAARRRGDHVATALLATGSFALVASGVAVVTQPLGAIGVTGHQLRYLWPVAAFATVAVAVALAPRRWTVAGAILAVAVLVALNVPGSPAGVGPANDVDVIPVVRRLAAQLDDLDVDEPLLYDTTGVRFAEPWTPAVIAALMDRGVDVDVEEEFWVRQLGERRRTDGDARTVMYLREGDAAERVPAGARRVAFVDGLSDAERRQLDALERGLADVEVSLNDAGRAAHELEPLPFFRDDALDVAEMVESGWLSVFVNAGVVDYPSTVARDVERYADLWYRANRLTVALFVEPIDERG